MSTHKLVILFLCTTFMSCTTMHFRSQGDVRLVVGLKDEHHIIRDIEGVKQYFLWGTIPRVHSVRVDKEVEDLGFTSGANVSVEEYQSFGNFVLSILSLGMYIPKNYRITVYGRRAKLN